jgi:hypothetical protein
MIGTILVFVLTLGASVLWLTRALDDQALDTSRRLGEAALANTLGQLSMLEIDYAKRGEAVTAVEAGDEPWLHENMGLPAKTAVASNLIVLWGGPLGGPRAADLGWTDDEVAAAQGGLLAPGLVDLAESKLAHVPLHESEGVSFFAWQGGELFALATSRIERDLESHRAECDDRQIARLLVGRRIDGAEIDTASRPFWPMA